MESREKQTSLTNRLLFKVGLIVFAALVAAIFLGKTVQNEIQEYTDEKDSIKIRENLTKINARMDEVGALSRDVTDLTREIDRYIGEVKTLAEEKATVSA